MTGNDRNGYNANEMTTIAPTPPPLQQPVMEGISWQTYEALLRELCAAGSHLRVTYDQGRMVVMSPLPIHEKWKQIFDRLIVILSEARRAPISAYGSTTWKREVIKRGLEPDQCYYVQHAPQMRGREDIDLEIDPPPDLAIEVDVTNHPIDRMSIYASLKIPEVWRYRRRQVECWHLDNDRYELREESLAFPGFKPSALAEFLRMHPAMLDSEIAEAFREWLKSQPN